MTRCNTKYICTYACLKIINRVLKADWEEEMEKRNFVSPLRIVKHTTWQMDISNTQTFILIKQLNPCMRGTDKA